MRVELANCLLFASIRVTSADWFVLVDTASYFSPAAENFSCFCLLVNFSHLLQVAHFSAPAPPSPISHRQYSADKRADDNGLQTRPAFSFERTASSKTTTTCDFHWRAKEDRDTQRWPLASVSCSSSVIWVAAMPNSSPETN
jgi:hypothetical protein